MTGTNLSVGTDVLRKRTARPSGSVAPIWQDVEEGSLTGCHQLRDRQQAKASRCHPSMAQSQALPASKRIAPDPSLPSGHPHTKLTQLKGAQGPSSQALGLVPKTGLLRSITFHSAAI